jgi:hypothetical protein
MNDNDNFPIYSTLLKDVSGDDLRPMEKKELIRGIKKLDAPFHNILLAMILKHAMVNGWKVGDGVPYGGIKAGRNLTFDIQQIDNVLGRLLLSFVRKQLALAI